MMEEKKVEKYCYLCPSRPLFPSFLCMYARPRSLFPSFFPPFFSPTLRYTHSRERWGKNNQSIKFS